MTVVREKHVAQSEDSSWNKRIQSQFGISLEVSSAQKCVSPLGSPEKEGRAHCVADVKDLKTRGKKKSPNVEVKRTVKGSSRR